MPAAAFGITVHYWSNWSKVIPSFRLRPQCLEHRGSDKTTTTGGLWITSTKCGLFGRVLPYWMRTGNFIGRFPITFCSVRCFFSKIIQMWSKLLQNLNLSLNILVNRSWMKQIYYVSKRDISTILTDMGSIINIGTLLGVAQYTIQRFI